VGIEKQENQGVMWVNSQQACKGKEPGGNPSKGLLGHFTHFWMRAIGRNFRRNSTETIHLAAAQSQLL